MATWNTDKPAVANTIAADIPDIEECLQELHDVITAITNGTLGTTTAANFKVDVLADGADCGDTPVITTGINDGTQDIDFPTNNMSACKFMTGNSSTITWFYLNTAPPGWKALTTGADTVCGIAGGTGNYNVSGGNPDSGATWVISGLTKDAHTHNVVVPSAGWGTIGSAQPMSTLGGNLGYGTAIYGPTSDRTLTSGAQSASGVTSAGTWRASASVGKLFQFDTA